MCTYITEIGPMAGSGKGATGWFSVIQANVYFDHPYHAPFDHSLNIDFTNPELGPAARVAVELSAESARELIRLIEAALAAGEAAHAIFPEPVVVHSHGQEPAHAHA